MTTPWKWSRRRSGNRLRTLEDVRAVHVRGWLDDLLRDARLAVRGFRKSPAMAAAAVAAIAIGVGASTAIFGVVDPLLFRGLPYPNGHRLVSAGYLGPVDSYEFSAVGRCLDWLRATSPCWSKPTPACGPESA
jgi:hypothetical protein